VSNIFKQTVTLCRNIAAMKLAWFMVAVATAFLAALCAFPALALDRWKRAAVLAALAVPVALSPLWIPAQASAGRLLAAMNAIALLVKLYDLHVSASGSRRPDFRTFVLFLPNWFSIVWRRLAQEGHPTMRENLVRLAQSVWRLAIAVVILVGLFRIDWTAVPFALEHCAKALALFITLIPASALGATLWRMAGGRAREFMDAPLLAPTPADFWRRYNRPAQQFFYEDVFKQVGAYKSPLLAAFATFVVSALAHEYVFGVTLGSIQGYQTAFFLSQGLGVIATVRLRPSDATAWLWIAATWIFNLATSLFFFASLHAVVPFYSRGLPKWLSGWSLFG
jgi:D-alanyl-lipoteichoic acid acyltransferase DltB (MBOAT superfamily)